MMAVKIRPTEVARIEPSSGADDANRGWGITLELDIGRVVLPSTYRLRSLAESAAREHVATLGLEVMSASYTESAIELELQRARPH